MGSNTQKHSENRKPSKKKVEGDALWSQNGLRVVQGKLDPGRGRPSGAPHLFKYVAEKLPFECLGKVMKSLSGSAERIEGVYLAHDSMGIARYGGRGQIFARLSNHKKRYPKELLYFSFYVIEQKKHEREVENVILRAAGPQMTLNKRKVALGTEPGDVRDYEPGTKFFERQRTRGRKAKMPSAKRSAAKVVSGKRRMR